MTDCQYKPIEIPDFLIQKIERRRKMIHKPSSFSYYLYFILNILACLFLAIGTIFNIKPLLLVGIVFLVAKLLYGWLFVNKPLYGKMYWYIEKQLKQRKVINGNELDGVWEGSECTAIARKINSICIKYTGWKDWVVFLPEDAFTLMIKLYTGDLCEVEAITAIEEEFSLKFPVEYFNEEKLGELKFKDVVDYIIRNTKHYHNTSKFTRKRLKGIAAGLVGTFVSRYNSIEGYWAFGVLYKLAKKAGTSNFELDLLSAQANLQRKNSKKLVTKYKNFLLKQLTHNGFDRYHVTKATIEIDFDVSMPVSSRIKKSTWGEPYRCRAIIVDDLHKEHSWESYGWCGIHNPQKELKSS